MKKMLCTLLLCSVSTSSFASDEWTGHASLYLGTKVLESSDWEKSVDKHDSGGLITDFKKQSWPVSIAIDVIGSGKDKVVNGRKEEGYTAEIDLGVRKVWDLDRLPLQPYVGGGLAFVGVSQESSGSGSHIKSDDDAIGAWVGIGTYWNITERFHVGVDMRYTTAEVELAGIDVEAGGYHAGVLAGLSW